MNWYQAVASVLKPTMTNRDASGLVSFARAALTFTFSIDGAVVAVANVDPGPFATTFLPYAAALASDAANPTDVSLWVDWFSFHAEVAR